MNPASPSQAAKGEPQPSKSPAPAAAINQKFIGDDERIASHFTLRRV
jgi:hypothetical protein